MILSSKRMQFFDFENSKLDQEGSLPKDTSYWLKNPLSWLGSLVLTSKRSFSIFLAVFSWYISSLGITMLNKYLFDTLHFNFPLLVTFINFFLISICISLIFFFFPKVIGGSTAPTFLISNVSWKKIIPIAILGALDVSLANLSYPEVSLSVITVMRSSSIIVIYILSVLMKIEKFSFKFSSVISIIFLSISFTVTSMEVKRKIGIVFLIGSVLAGGLRWVLVHEQLHASGYTPLELMFLTQPICAISLAVPAFYMDLNRLVFDFSSTEIYSDYGYMKITALISLTVFWGFVIMISEYYFVSLTSSVSLTVAGIGKEIATILLSVILFHDNIDLKTSLCVTVSLCAIFLYSYLRYLDLKCTPHFYLTTLPLVSLEHDNTISCCHKELIVYNQVQHL